MLEIIPNDLSVASITSLSAREPIKEEGIFMLEELEKDNLESFSTSTPSSEDDNSQYCLQCGTEFVENRPHQHISSRSTCDPQICNGCRKLFTVVSDKNDIIERFNGVVARKYKIEARFLQDWYLHRYNPEKPQKDELYHLPLSEHYYRRRVDENSQATFTYFCSRDDLHKVEQYVCCNGCKEFITAKQRTLRFVTDKKSGPGRPIPEVKELFELLVSSKSTCSLTGMKGSWAPFPAYRPKRAGKNWVRDHFVKNAMFFLSLDHIVPLAAGGSSLVSNLQVTLQGFNNVKAHYSFRDFQKWLKSFKLYQGF